MEWHLVPFPYKMIPPPTSLTVLILARRMKKGWKQAFDRHLLQQEDIKGGNLQNKLHLEGSHISLLSILTVERTERFSGSLTR